MNPVYINFQGVNQVNLSGESDLVIQGCRYSPGVGVVSVSTITETMELVLGGTEDAIDLKVLQIERLLEVAANAVIRLDWVYLRFYAPAVFGVGFPGDIDYVAPFPLYDWRSRVLGGRVELGGKGLIDRAGESQIVKVQVVRQNYWTSPKVPAHTFTKADVEPFWTRPVGGISSHTDGGHDNGFGVCGHDLYGGDLESPLELMIENVSTSDTLESFTISQRFIRGIGRLDAGFVEADDWIKCPPGAGVGAVTSADAACSSGFYVTYTWAGSVETKICSWLPASNDLVIMRGQTHRPIVRLRDTLAYSDLWGCVKVLDHSSGAVLQESLWMLVPAGTKYVELPTVNIPPALSGFDAFRAVDVGLYLRRAGGGVVKVDFVQFTPVERIRRITSLGSAVPVGAGKYLVDSGILEETFYQDGAGNKEATHIGQGEYLKVIPGYDSMIRVLHRSGGDGVWAAGVVLNFYGWYEPRRRNL